MTGDMNAALRRSVRGEPEAEPENAAVQADEPTRRVPRADAGAGRTSKLATNAVDDLNAALRAAWRGKRQ